MILSKQLYLKRGFLKTLWLFVSHFFRSLVFLFASNSWTKTKAQRQRGLPFLTLKEDKSLQCNACGLCVGFCPTHAIDLATSDSGDFVDMKLDILKCTSCGFCQEVCPIDALRIGQDQASAMHVESNWVLDSKDLSRAGVLSRLAK